MTTSLSEAARIIAIVAAVVHDSSGRALLVRKEGTDCFLLPGGKPAPGETPVEALERELREELGCGLATKPRLLGQFSAPAANEPGQRVEALVFIAQLAGEPRAGAEICELVWYDPAFEAAFPIAPLARDQVFPAVLAELQLSSK